MLRLALAWECYHACLSLALWSVCMAESLFILSKFSNSEIHGHLLRLKRKLRPTLFFISRETFYVYRHYTVKTFPLFFLRVTVKVFFSVRITALLNINYQLIFLFSSGGFLIYLWGVCTCVSEKVKERKEYANTAAVIVCNYSARVEIKIM